RLLERIDFQSKGRRPEELDIQNPIVPQAPEPGLSEAPSAGARDAKTLKAAYYAMIKQIDDQVGRMLDVLEETGQRENTGGIFMSDHGEMLGDHGLIKKGCRFYEGLVRVPLIVSWPGRFSSGVRSSALVELTDLAPTLLELAGREVPEKMQGRSLVQILKGEVSPGQHREFVRSEYYDALDRPDGTFATMYRDARYKLVVYHGHGVGELYDLESDPGEFEDLWDDSGSQGLKVELMQKSFDASMLGMDRGPRRVGPM
ncbi:MAG: sulfatase-like hydrolase/transferase, partial [bacterium]|nr:sulfatase-like hydrolase/transferase [bacterium]